MVPVGQCDDALLGVLPGIRIFWVLDNEGRSYTIGVLTFRMGMVPVATRLVQLLEWSALIAGP